MVAVAVRQAEEREARPRVKRSGAGRQPPCPVYLARCEVDLGSVYLTVGELDPMIWERVERLQALDDPLVRGTAWELAYLLTEWSVAHGIGYGVVESMLTAVRTHCQAISGHETRRCREYTIVEPSVKTMQEVALTRMALPPTVLSRAAEHAQRYLAALGRDPGPGV